MANRSGTMMIGDWAGQGLPPSHMARLERKEACMALELWRPLLDLEKDWDALFRLPLGKIERGDYRPSMDVARTDGELVVSTELPGIDPDEDVEITLEAGHLTIKGDKTEEKEISEDDRYLRERRFGSFMRRIPVPDDVRADMIKADYTDGVLTVRVALPEETATTEPQTIPVSSA